MKNNSDSCDFNANKYSSPSFQKGAEMLCIGMKLQKQKFKIKYDSLIYTLDLRDIKYSKTKKDVRYLGVNLKDGNLDFIKKANIALTFICFMRGKDDLSDKSNKRLSDYKFEKLYPTID